MDNKKSYDPASFEEIEKYFSGKMSSAEMHAMEEAALNDPFLAEAMEGFHDQQNNWSEIKKNASLLNQNLTTKATKKKAPVFFINPVLLRVAAIFMVLLLAGGIAWYTWYRGNPSTTILADNTIHQKIQKDTITQLIDTTLLADNKSSQGKTAIQKSSTQRTDISVEKDSKKIVQAAPVNAMQENILADSIETFPGKSGTNKADAPFLISQNKLTFDTLPTPVEGRNAFNQYVNERAVFYKKIMLKNYISGIVKIDFEISKSGQPSNYKIVQSLSPIMDSLASKILQEGPLWKPATNTTNSSVEIHF
ncbi:MAG: energy transducer TonB [Chitinophagaceae bacterium]